MLAPEGGTTRSGTGTIRRGIMVAVGMRRGSLRHRGGMAAMRTRNCFVVGIQNTRPSLDLVCLFGWSRSAWGVVYILRSLGEGGGFRLSSVALRCVALLFVCLFEFRGGRKSERGVSCLVSRRLKQRRSITTGVSADFLRISGDSSTYRDRESSNARPASFARPPLEITSIIRLSFLFLFCCFVFFP
jgi:hypothetical protein